MLSYVDLTVSQRKWVDLVEIYFPSIIETVTFQQLREIHEFFVAKRSEDPRFKCAFALWLVSNNAIERGIYRLPSKTAHVEGSTAIDPALEPGYQQRLISFGIKV